MGKLHSKYTKEQKTISEVAPEKEHNGLASYLGKVNYDYKAPKCIKNRQSGG